MNSARFESTRLNRLQAHSHVTVVGDPRLSSAVMGLE